MDQATDRETAPTANAATQFTLAELAERSSVSSRTIRFYQTKKLLPRPRKDATDGRVARYGEEHLERLDHIGKLSDRGLTLPAIRQLLDADDAAAQVSHWLGLDSSLGGSWSAEEPQLLSDAELDGLLAGTPGGTRAVLERDGLLARQGASWLVPSPGLLSLTSGLIRDGIDADIALQAGDVLRKHLQRAAVDLMKLFQEAFDAGLGDGADPGEVLQPLRPIAGDAARFIFAQELERAIADVLADPKQLPRSRPQ